MKSLINNFVVFLPASKTLSYHWNYGSMLGMVLVIQILTGIFLSFYYCSDSSLAYDSVMYIGYNVAYGWEVRSLHFNGASLFFVFVYLHIFKGLYMYSYRLLGVWFVGLLIYFLLMGEAFLGYVLVWSQMSFWAGMVIVSLLSSIPVWGQSLTYWVWSGFMMNSETLKFFFVMHFLIPFVIYLLVIIHLVFLHSSGSTSLIYCHGDYDKLSFGYYYWYKDLLNVLFFLLYFFVSYCYPYAAYEPEMFQPANYSSSPSHIVPEWYFLYAYAILRVIPNKLMGVVFMLLSILMFFIFIVFFSEVTPMDKINSFLVSLFIVISVVLSWLGHTYIVEPYVTLGVIFVFLYFFVFLLIFLNYWGFGLFYR